MFCIALKSNLINQSIISSASRFCFACCQRFPRHFRPANIFYRITIRSTNIKHFDNCALGFNICTWQIISIVCNNLSHANRIVAIKSNSISTWICFASNGENAHCIICRSFYIICFGFYFLKFLSKKYAFSCIFTKQSRSFTGH